MACGLIQAFSKLSIEGAPRLLAANLALTQFTQVRNFPKPVVINGCYKRIVYKPEEYTTDRLPMRKLGGRDPVTGRRVAGRIGGGHKQKYRWVRYDRDANPDGSPQYERVLKIAYDPCRTAKIAMVASGTQKRWIVATNNMKSGDLLKTSKEISQIAIRASEGDSHPVGALPVGAVVSGVELFPGKGGYLARAAGTSCQIIRKIGNNVVVQAPSKQEMLVKKECMCVVGQVSNPDHNKMCLGTPQRLRWLGIRPGSGLWHRKDGYAGRKIRPLPPMRVYDRPVSKEEPIYKLTL